MSTDLERGLALMCRRLFDERSHHLLLGRYELIRTLGRGGEGVVYEAFDRARQERVAIKLLQGCDLRRRRRFEREFRSLAQVRHPNVVALRDVVVEGDHAYFTMDLIDGQDIVAYARNGLAAGVQITDRARLRAAFAQLANAVGALHAAGKLHRDLKPANVRVTEEGRVVLLDFGLVEEPSTASDVEGTPHYMAPERFAGIASPSSDWYAFGRMLFEALWGYGAAEPSRRVPAARDPFDRLAARLLDPRPAHRPCIVEVHATLATSQVLCQYTSIEKHDSPRRS